MILPLVFAVLSLAGDEPAPQMVFLGEEDGGRFGAHADGVPDLDGDGVRDILIGARGEGDEGHGVVYVLSGADGAELYSLSGENERDEFGGRVYGLRDVDGDGFGDFVVVAARFDGPGVDVGRVSLHSGVDGATIATREGEADGDFLGTGLAVLGDVSGDGIDDLALGCPSSDLFDRDAGWVSVVSGVDLSELVRIPGGYRLDLFGWNLATPGDVDGDGKNDLLAGSPGANGGRGKVELFSSADWSLVHRIDGSNDHERLGVVSGVGDVDLDGVPDLLMGSFEFNSSTGRVHLHSGADASLIGRWNGEDRGDHFGISLAGPGDLNGDGIPDFAVGATDADGVQTIAGAVSVYSGASLERLVRLPGQKRRDGFGRVFSLGDLDGDGHGDLLVGASEVDEIEPNAGWAGVYTSTGLLLDLVPRNPAPGESVQLVTGPGLPSTPLLVVLRSVDESPSFQLLFTAAFDSEGDWIASAAAPPGLSGVRLGLSTLGFHRDGRLQLSPVQELRFD